MLPKIYLSKLYILRNFVMTLQYYNFLSIAILAFLFGGCRGSSTSSIPDAPPPYPSFPVPQERYNSAQVYGGPPNTSSYIPPYTPPQITNGESGPTFYTPPPSFPPTHQSATTSPSLGYTPTNVHSQKKANKTNVNTARFTLEANADLWALVQNSEGVELEWLKMKKGESAKLHHSGRLTITCSSGNQLIIKDKDQKVVQTTPNKSGISIVRLPSS